MCCACSLQVAKALPKLCVMFHEDVQLLAADFKARQGRHYFVTPTSFLELLTSYKTLLAKKQDEVRGCLLHTCFMYVCCLASCSVLVLVSS